jgi:hypothetical protein
LLSTVIVTPSFYLSQKIRQTFFFFSTSSLLLLQDEKLWGGTVQKYPTEYKGTETVETKHLSLANRQAKVLYCPKKPKAPRLWRENPFGSENV